MNKDNPQVKIIVLLNGQHMIGRIIKQDDKETSIESPAIILSGDDKADRQKMSLAFAPFLPFSSDKVFNFNSDMILTTSIPADALTNEYNRMFGSGLDIITKPSLII